MCLLDKRTFVLSSQKHFGINLQAAGTVMKRRHCRSSIQGQGRGLRFCACGVMYSVFAHAHTRAVSGFFVCPGAPVSRQPKGKKLVEQVFHEMKGDRDGKSATSATRNSLMQL